MSEKMQSVGGKAAKPDIALFEPDIGVPEEEAVLQVLRSGWLAMGPKVAELEQRFAAMIGSRHAVALNSCTAALHLACLCADLKPGDEVIVPSLTFAATANAVRYVGATPVFADIAGEDDWTIDPEDVARLITNRTRAIIPMHYAGHPCDMDHLSALADKHDLAIIEDACHGLMSRLNGRALGTIGQTGCFSFYSNKIITTGEGGMLVTDDARLAERARLLRAHGLTNTSVDRSRGALGYDVVELGYNYRLDDIRAAIGLAQLDRLESSVVRRREITARYRELLANMPGVRVPEHGARGEAAPYIFTVYVDKGIDREAVRRHMADHGVQTSIHYPPVHLYRHYSDNTRSLPNTEGIASRAISLPLYPSLGDGQVERVCEALTAAIAAVRSRV